MTTTSRWHELATHSHYQTATAIRDELLQGDVEEAIEGIEELIEALSRSDRRELRNELTRLMAHIIKWKSQPNRRGRSWRNTIANARLEIDELVEHEPSLRPLLAELIVELFPKAKRYAEQEMGKRSPITALSWQEIFEETYLETDSDEA